MDILISAEELHRKLETGDDVRVLDVRWKAGGPPGEAAYLEGHIPGAVYVDLDTELAGNGSPEDGRHPLPDVADLQSAARRWGVRAGDTVVVYDDAKNLSSSRAWWLLHHAGLERVRILDGSLRAWTNAGYPLARGEEVPPEGDVVLEYGTLDVIGADEAAAFAESGTLLDARAGERFRGEVEPLDPKAGHIPGAISAPTAENVDRTGRFLSPEALRERFESLGLKRGEPVGVYCGSGVTASHEAVALILAGFSPALFPGSWSAWSNQPERPVAIGP
jgi:thiosulfate/3-mercaptopyruvate sulfurtransferase